MKIYSKDGADIDWFHFIDSGFIFMKAGKSFDWTLSA